MQRSDYGYANLTLDQYTAIVQAGSMGGTSPMLGATNYHDFTSACQGINCDPRVLLSGLLWEGHFGCDPGLAAARVNNLAGIKWAEQQGAYDSGIVSTEGDNYAGFLTLGAFFQEYARTLTNNLIGPSFAAGDLVRAWAIYVGGPNNPNMAAGQKRLAEWQYYVATYPPSGSPSPPATVTPDAIVAAAMNHLGATHEYDPWNGDHVVYMFCEADVEDWCYEAGATQPRYVSAAAAGDAKPLNIGPAPLGALVYFRGPGWSPFDHTGISLGDGRTISGLQSVTISAGWQVPAMGYRGWRYPDGVAPAPAPDPNAPVQQDGNPYGTIDIAYGFLNNVFRQVAPDAVLRILGYAMTPDVPVRVTEKDGSTWQGRGQFFERATLLHDPRQPDPKWQDTAATADQLIEQIGT